MLVVEGEEVGRNGPCGSVSGLMWVQTAGGLVNDVDTGETRHLKCH